jgi:hypothetical protein
MKMNIWSAGWTAEIQSQAFGAVKEEAVLVGKTASGRRGGVFRAVVRRTAQPAHRSTLPSAAGPRALRCFTVAGMCKTLSEQLDPEPLPQVILGTHLQVVFKQLQVRRLLLCLVGYILAHLLRPRRNALWPQHWHHHRFLRGIKMVVLRSGHSRVS